MDNRADPSLIVDLTIEQAEGNATHPIHGRTPLFLPGTGSHALTRMWGHTNPYDGSPLSVANEVIMISGHTGTHLDAPFHVDSRSPYTVDRIPLDRTMGIAIWLDLSSRARPATLFQPDDLAWAEEDGGERIQPGDIVLVHTGWLRPGPELNITAYITNAPAFSKAAGEWLRSRGIGALGMDLPTPDVHTAVDLPVHVNFLRPQSLGLAAEDFILIYENLVNIDRIPTRRFTFHGAPIPFRGATGSPVRALAYV